MYTRFIALLAAAALGSALTIHSARAVDAFPTRALSIIVPFAPGGVTDLLARIVAQKLSEKLGQPVVIENKGGAGTIVAAVTVSKAPPDGYTLMMATGSTMSIKSSLYKQLPYDPDKELTPVALVASSPFLLITNPDLPVKSVEDLIKLAKETQMNEVPYRGTTPALADTMAGHIEFMFVDVAAGEGVIKDNKVRVLGISTAKRFEGLPDVPTIAESGVPGFEGDSWQMIVAPAKTPRDVVIKLNAAITEIVAQADVRARMIKLGTAPGGKQTTEELRRFVDSETSRWGKVLSDAGVAHSQ